MSEVFRTMLKKHIHVAFKRRRLLTSLWPAIMYSIISIVLFRIFAQIDSGNIRALLLALTIPLYLLLAVQSALQNAMAEIVTEKESKMKIVQEIYGLTPTMYWLSWAGYFSIVSCLCVLATYVLLALVAPVMGKSSPIFVICLLVLSYLQQFEFAAIVSVFFNKLQTATAMSGFVNLLFLLLAEAMQGWLRGGSRFWWYLGSLLPAVNIFNGFAAVMFSEALYYCDESGCYQGISSKTAFASQFCFVPYDEAHGSPCPQWFPVFSAGESMIMILLDIVLYGFGAWLLEQVWQGDFGQAKPWLFCLDPAYMCPRRHGRRDSRDAARSLVQSDGLQEALAMKIRNLRKVFPEGKVAVDGMDLDIKEGEIFALLGHNGAGKTTCINCVVGLIPMTSGEAMVCGYDVRTELESVRRNISVCPQDNPLYDVFTVRQHLMFFASLRGVSEQVQETRVIEVLRALGIGEKVDQQCTTLSGGQKRRLWVASALLGDIPVIFLDEPTSGMDPSSRQHLWKLLLEMKSTGRSIIFTTHYLEEADVLADRKAVLARGRVEASGTSLDLKLQFGLGYQLQLQFPDGVVPDPKALSDVSELIVKHIPLATRKEEDAASVSTERREHIVAFTLAFDQVDKFGPMLIELDSKKQAMGILTYSISMTTLEEVFMALGEKAEREAAESGRAQGENTGFREVEQEADPEHGEVYRADADERRSAKAIMRVRLRLATANRSAIFSVLVLPTMLNLLAVFMEGGKSAAGGASSGQAVGLAIYPPMAFGISIVAFTLQLVREKEVKTKHVSLAQGLQVRSFWLGTVMAHYLVNVLNSLILVSAILIQGDQRLTGNGFPLILVEALIYPVCLLLMAYNFSMLFTQVEFASKVLPLTNILLGTVPTSVIYILLQNPQLQEGAEITHAVMSVTNPVYGLPGVILMMMSKGEMSLLGHLMSPTASPLYGSIILCVVLTTNLIYQDARSRTAIPGNYQEFDGDHKDDDVRGEEDRVEWMLSSEAQAAASPRQDAVVYHRLHHTYRTRNCCTCFRRRGVAPVETPAVRGISLGIKAGECFGLLGPNGAGKTTTLAVLTGEVRPPTAGQVHILGHDVTTPEGMMEAYKNLGVCPQVDPLWENLTGKEHLMFFGRIKGVPEATLSRKVDDLLYRLGLNREDSNRKSTEYSGGMKRKLSLAIALIGRSPLLFLDEPSAAVDAGAKRHLWKVLRRRGREQTVVVTTHSMEEAEALCDRIAIQVRGQLRCLGSPDHIKKEYGSGCQLELFCDCRGADAESKAQELRGFVETLAPGSGHRLEHHGTGRFLFQLPKDSSLGQIFLGVEQNKIALGISYYFINQPSLEQVFVRFAREQEDDV